jgi:hypothetical protein
MSDIPCLWPAKALRESVDWQKFKDILHRLYILERRTLKEVKEVMEATHGFPSNLRLVPHSSVPVSFCPLTSKDSVITRLFCAIN